MGELQSVGAVRCDGAAEQVQGADRLGGAYFHTEAARLFGATEDEIMETALIAKNTMGWSTYLNTLQFDYDAFVE
ncbi:MAG TPA: hypothetical protein VH231_06480, partial [Solirubrobacteraceae bacterium]|nr:hypothetical protein [Solirubrobacteraceae bacterium]